MDKGDLLERLVEKAGVSEETVERVLEVVLEDMAAAVRERAERRPLEVPPYFDRYVATEIAHLGSRIEDLREEMNRRFEGLAAEMSRRFEETNRRFDGLATEMNRRFEETNRRFEEMNRRFEEVDRRFDRLERWFFRVGIPIVLGILAILFRVFFGL